MMHDDWLGWSRASACTKLTPVRARSRETTEGGDVIFRKFAKGGVTGEIRGMDAFADRSRSPQASANGHATPTCWEEDALINRRLPKELILRQVVFLTIIKRSGH